MADRSYLPELESAEGSAYGATLRSGITVVMVLILVLSISLAAAIYGIHYIFHQKDAGFDVLQPFVLMIVSVALAIAIGRLIVADFYWKTDRSGLFARGLLRRRFIPWTDINGFELGGTVSCKLHLRTATITLSVPVEDWPCNAVGASSLQHLNWQNREDSNETFPSEILDYWNTVPDSTPREVAWANKRKSPMIFASFIACFMIGMCIFGTITSYVRKGAIDAAWFAVPMLLALWSDVWHRQVKPALDTARQLSVDSCGINAIRMGSSISLRWERIGAYDISYDDTEVSVALRSKQDRKRLIIELDENDDDSKLALLAIIRRLKELHPDRAIPVPSALIAEEPEAEEETPPLWLQRLWEESSE